MFALLFIAGCTVNLAPTPDTPVALAPPATVQIVPETPAPGEPPVDLAQALLERLGDSVWHGTTNREGRTRVVEHHIQASTRQWAEVVNPWGPATHRQMREFHVDGDGVTVSSTVVVPAGWEDDPEEGDTEQRHLQLVDGAPRELHLTQNGHTEVFVEGPAPQQMEGFTAHARVFHPGDGVDAAFCDSGFSEFDYPTIFDFARGFGPAPAASDAAAGVPLGDWVDPGSNAFSVSDVPGFARDGGTELTDQYNFFVTYRGIIDHPGGEFTVRETDDRVEDGVWVFLGDAAGSGGGDDYFFEVNGFYWPDGTWASPSINLPPGPLAVEVIIARCTETIEPVTLEFSLGGEPWMPAAATPVVPVISDADFPAPF